MVAASVSLVLEGGKLDWPRAALGVLVGVAFIIAVSTFLHAPHHAQAFGSLRGDDAIKGLLIVGVMTVHSVAEGVGVGAAFGGGETLGLLIAIAIAVQQHPRGTRHQPRARPARRIGEVGGGLEHLLEPPQPLLAVPAFLFVEAFAGILPAALGFAAGAMVWMVARELLPEAFARRRLGVCWLPAGRRSPRCSRSSCFSSEVYTAGMGFTPPLTPRANGCPSNGE